MDKGEPVWTTRGYGKDYTLPAEAGTVNAINTAATPQVWGHEYRHQEKIDRLLTTLGSDQVFDKTSYDVFSSKGGNFEEVNNRILDVRSAQNAKEMKEPLKYLITNDIYETQSKLATTTKEKETRKLEDKLQQLNDIYFIIPITTNNNNKYDSLKCLLRLLLFVPITTHNNKHSLFHCVIDHVLISVLTCKCVMTV